MTNTTQDRTIATGITYLSAHDLVLALVISRNPLYTPASHTNYYQELVESIISQQLSVKAAATILKRFVELFGSNVFPSPEVILTKTSDELRAVGLSYQKAGYIQDLALKVIDGTVQFDHLDTLSNDEIITELTQVKGIGVWTVHMFMMFCMGRLDVLPVGDLGIRKGIQKMYGLDIVPTPDAVMQIAHTNQWHPYESIASWYVWKSLDTT